MLTGYNINAFKRSNLLSVDIETKDNLLTVQGPGTHRGDGFICGVSMTTQAEHERIRHYFSFAHPDTPSKERVKNKRIVADILKEGNPKIGANIGYDVEWLEHEGHEVNGKLHDVQFAEPLLNEYKRSFSLNNLAKGYNLDEKKSNVLEEYNKTMGWKGKPIENIWRMPSTVAGEYALHDSDLPLDIFERQKRNLETQNLWDLYLMETDLIPVLLEMRRNGVRLDMPLLQKVSLQAADVKYSLEQEVFEYFGTEFNANSTKQIADLFDIKGIPYPRNEPTPAMKKKGKTEGNPNLDKKVLNNLAKRFPICGKILEYRHYETLINLFLNKYSNFQVAGRLYCQFHPLRNDDYGTVSGRFSSSKPNLQQVSAKDENKAEEAGLDELKGKIVRRLFLPEEGCDWAKLDYSQIEYRVLAHYATGEGADELRASYNEEKSMDYHQRIMDLTGLERRPAKTINFGSMYGMGQKATAEMIGCTMQEADLFMTAYHNAAPYVKATRYAVQNTAARRRFLFTLMNRRARVHVSRKLHSLFNRLIQGSAADIMKKAMVDAYKAGIFDVLPLHLTVHDEMDVSVPRTKIGKEALRELEHCMEHTVKLNVPIFVDCHTGKNWAEAD